MKEQIERRQRERRELLARLYVVTDGSVSEFVDIFAAGDALGIDRVELRRHLEYMAEKGWVVVDDFRAGIARITAMGVDRAEALLQEE